MSEVCGCFVGSNHCTVKYDTQQTFGTLCGFVFGRFACGRGGYDGDGDGGDGDRSDGGAGGDCVTMVMVMSMATMAKTIMMTITVTMSEVMA